MVTEEARQFGACPDCGHYTGYINIGAAHWFYCTEHKTCWIPGWNLFSHWREQTREEQEAAYNTLDLGSYVLVVGSESEAAEYRNVPGSNRRLRVIPGFWSGGGPSYGPDCQGHEYAATEADWAAEIQMMD